MTAVAEQIGSWLEAFTRQSRAPQWIEKARDAAFQRFSELGFPTTRDEEWRFTNVAAIARAEFEVGQAPGLPSEIPEEAEPFLAQSARIERNPFVALNTAFLDGVQFVRVPRGAVIEKPFEISHKTGQVGDLPYATHPRTLIVVGEGAQCTVIETYTGSGTYFTNAVTEIVAGEGAVVDHYKVQNESPEAFHIATMQATIGRSANLATCSISLGGKLSRHDIGVTLAEGAEAALNGLYLATGSQHVDHHTTLDHAAPHATSRELYKGILDGNATGVFNGRVIVRQDAQKTDSKQTNQNLMLSDEAVIHTKPELQIHADDVRCTHGATVGQLDAEAVFYLQSRGIGKDQARTLLTYAFAQDIADRIKVPALKDSLERVLFERFHEHSR